MAVKGFGPESARIMIIGEAPGRDEVREGRPFVGAAGKLLRECLAGVGIHPDDDVFYSNISQERPPNNDLSTFFDPKGFPSPTIIDGLTALQAEINRVSPNIIIPVGAYPLRFLTDKGTWNGEGFSGISNYRGYRLVGSDFCGKRQCLPTYHPAAALRQYSLKHLIRADLAKAKRYVGESTVQYPRKCIVLDPRGADRDLWANWLCSPPGTPSPLGIFASEGTAPVSASVASGGFLSADIEYIGSKLLCLGVTRHRDVAVVFLTQSAADVRFIRDLLLSGIPLCFQNAMFDCSILEWFYNIPCIEHLAHDTMIAMHAAYIEMQKDLGFIGSIHTDSPPWWQHVDGKFWKEIRDGKRSIMEILPYNAYDTMVTHEAMEKMLDDELLEPSVMGTYQHEMSLIKPLWDIAKRGVRIDTESLSKLQTELQFEANAYLYGISKYNGGAPVNVKSNPQVAKFVYQTMSIPQLGAKTPAGAWKMDDSTLANLQLRCRDERQRTAIRMVREARERLDLISKFCEIELDEDGRMRCHYDPAKTLTGRLSSRKFAPTGRGANLQNVPRDFRVRAVFIPDRGKVFGYADLKSAESYVVAHITGDPEMLRLHSSEYMDGTRDGHKYVASSLLDKPVDRITKDERYLGKRVRHAGNYSMGWNKLMTIVNADAQTTGVSIDAAQAKVLVMKYRQLHPFLLNWWSDVQAELWRTHTLYTLHNRKRIFYDRPDAILPDAIAYVPQGTIAQSLNMGLLQVAASEELAQLGFEMLLQVHDAIGFQVPEENLARTMQILPGLMDIPVTISRRSVAPYQIHIPVELQVGENWGESDEDPKHPGFTKDGKPALNPHGLKTYHVPAIP